MKKLAVVILAALLVVGIAGCGPSAEQVLKDSMKASKDIKTMHFNLEQTTKLPRAPIEQGKLEKQNYIQKSDGDYDLRTGNFQVNTQLMGTQVTMLQIENKQYWQFGGNWYEVPQSVAVAPPVSSALSISQYIKYFTSVKKLGNTEIDGESCYHVEAVPDMKELVKQPGISDLLKDPSGVQTRTVDELEEIKATFHFYVRTKDDYFKRSQAFVEARAPNELIQLGYAQAGDKIQQDAEVTFSKFNEKLDLKAPDNLKPWPGAPTG